MNPQQMAAELRDLRRLVAQMQRQLADAGIAQRRAEVRGIGAPKERDADSECEGLIGNIRISSLPAMTEEDYETDYRFLALVGDCLKVGSFGDCEPSDPGEGTNDCANCDGDVGGFVISIPAQTFWDYGSWEGSYHPEVDYRYGSESSIDLELIECTGTLTFAKLSGPGNQTWQVVKQSSTLLRIICLDTEEGAFVGIWEMTLSPGDCCPSGDATLVDYYSPTPTNPLTITSSGGPC